MINYQLSNLDDLQRASSLFKLLGHPKRLQLLYLLIQRSMTVSEISTALSWEQSAVSHQLQLLKRYNCVSYERNGKQIIYKLDNPIVITLIADAMGGMISK
ncbi:metalloregulator ArsR/SmtB family transcription factor [uncultured Limosilactobacillus sp.]|uniref:ArsR/SmtB family transcription factor n=1 Tax=uncultured Limosilactobacillus sp. TaxID=2837629 RepID=UPI0025E3A569|nr:metalloregulator ArsR/SmtB family transcription factor [uncultured Limosilactobacillus sp.]